MKDKNEYDYIYTINTLQVKIDSTYTSRANIYDKIGKLFPTINKFLTVNYWKIYVDGKQQIIEKCVGCHICGKDFGHNNAVMYDVEHDNDIIHIKCNTDRVNMIKRVKIKEIFDENRTCPLCMEECNDNDHVIMNDNTFFHKSCCANQIKNALKDNKCSICDELLFTNMNKSRLEFCQETKCKKNYAHITCAKENKEKKYKKTFAHTDFNRCGICMFYIMDEQHVHDICDNI